jgi:hypothetical protein
MRNVRSRISRPEAMFFPEVDVYQAGRKVPDRTVIPAMQPAVVPDSNVPVVLAEAARTASLPWNALQPAEWGLKAQELRALSEQLWFVDRTTLREPMFLLYAQIGYAAENQNHPAPPFYEQVGNFAVNYYWYEAAKLAYQEPALMGKITDPDLRGSIQYYLQQLQQGAFPSFKLDFEQENEWNEEQFNKDYELLINGIPVSLDANAQLDAFLGRTDIYLKRKDSGHGLSERLEALKIEESIVFVRDTARKKMGIDFIEQLFLHKNECTPEVDGDILNYLAIYQKLHDKAEVYIAVPEEGNPNKVWIWRYDREKAQLSLVGGGPDGFPVRFALVFSSGILYNGASMGVDSDLSDESSLAPDDVANTNRINTELEPATIPFNFELRGHYNRLMVNFGAEFGYNTGKTDNWTEYYQTPGKNKDPSIGAYKRSNCDYLNANTDADGDGILDSYDGPDEDTNPDSEWPRSCEITDVFNDRTFNRYMYFGTGVVLGRDAGIGFGPRFALRFGWLNMPHGLQTTAHFGWAIQPPIGDFGGRFRPLIDLDLRGGVNIDMPRSLHLEAAEADNKKVNGDWDYGEEKRVSKVFGLTAGIGFTF